MMAAGQYRSRHPARYDRRRKPRAQESPPDCKDTQRTFPRQSTYSYPLSRGVRRRPPLDRIVAPPKTAPAWQAVVGANGTPRVKGEADMFTHSQDHDGYGRKIRSRPKIASQRSSPAEPSSWWWGSAARSSTGA